MLTLQIQPKKKKKLKAYNWKKKKSSCKVWEKISPIPKKPQNGRGLFGQNHCSTAHTQFTIFVIFFAFSIKISFSIKLKKKMSDCNLLNH